MHQRTRPRTGLALLVGFVVLVAVSYGLATVYRSGSGSPPVPTVTAGPAAVARAEGLATGVTSLGTVVTSDGRTLYRFDRDTSRPPASHCATRCATTWPPLLARGGRTPRIAGVDSAAVGIVHRDDGGTQVTLKGWPLYTYSGDQGPGETNGEGVGGTWHAVGVDGRPVTAAPPAVPAAPAPASAEPAPAPDTEDHPSFGSGY